jgi:hypothetical protein
MTRMAASRPVARIRRDRSTGGLMSDDEAARHPMLERLDAFIGEWSIEASFGPR